MLSPLKLPILLFVASLSCSLPVIGCHAQTPAPTQTSSQPAEPASPLPTSTGPVASFPGTPLTPSEARRVEVLLRQKGNLPPASTVQVGPREPGTMAGFDTVMVTFTSEEGKVSRPIRFLISTDGKTLAQLSTFDISTDPRNVVSDEDRPARGGTEDAPVLIVGFDDLECPFCAKMHEIIFPALTARYGNLIHIVYRDFPLDQHPWAMRAAVDVNCLGAQSPSGYWTMVDYIHAHASEIGSDPKDPKADKTLATASDQIDKLTREQAAFQKADLTKLNACIAKQDTAAIEASRKLGEQLNVDSTPTLFINGAKIDGAVPIEFVDKIIDNALLAEGKTPPPYPTAAAAVVPAKK